MELTYYGNTILKLILYLCLFCVPVSSPKKKSMKPLTFVSWDLVFCLSLSAAASYMPGMPAVSPYGPNPNSG